MNQHLIDYLILLIRSAIAKMDILMMVQVHNVNHVHIDAELVLVIQINVWVAHSILIESMTLQKILVSVSHHFLILAFLFVWNVMQVVKSVKL